MIDQSAIRLALSSTPLMAMLFGRPEAVRPWNEPVMWSGKRKPVGHASYHVQSDLMISAQRAGAEILDMLNMQLARSELLAVMNSQRGARYEAACG